MFSYVSLVVRASVKIVGVLFAIIVCLKVSRRAKVAGGRNVGRIFLFLLHIVTTRVLS